MDFTGLVAACLGGFASIITAIAGLTAVVYRGNKKSREEVDDLRKKLLHANGLIYRLRMVLVEHGWMNDPDLVGAASDVVRAAETGESPPESPETPDAPAHAGSSA